MRLTKESFLPSLSLTERRINVDPTTRQIAVRVAGWNDVHGGFGSQVRMPRNVNVEAAHAGHAQLEDGSSLAVASLPMGTLHAAGGLSAEEARRVYEDTGRSVARVRYSLDDDGIRADGVLFDDVDDATLDRLTASAPSGDWRTLTHIRSMSEYEHAKADFVGAAIVNIPGFSGTYSQSEATPLRLVASAETNSIMLLEGDVKEDVVTPNDENLESECEGEGACENCTCGASEKVDVSAPEDTDAGPAAEDVDPLADLPDEVREEVTALQASIAEATERITALTAAGNEMDRITMLEERMDIFEEILNRAILSF